MWRRIWIYLQIFLELKQGLSNKDGYLKMCASVNDIAELGILKCPYMLIDFHCSSLEIAINNDNHLEADHVPVL